MLFARILRLILLLFVFVLFHGCTTKTSHPSTSAVPAWAKAAVWYQIFPERFRNGDSSNDPRFRDTFGSWPHDTISAWQPSPWTADWYKLQPWETANGKGFNYQAGRRHFGGDLQGVRDQLDYLQALGVTALYLNPIFEAPTLHKYDTQLYHHVDNNFGPNPQRDREIWATEKFDDPATWKWSTADSLFLKLMSSHDTERLGSMVVNPNRMIDHESSPQHNPNFDVRKPNAEELHIQKLIVAFQMLYSGAPTIYYGEEAGMWGADDPDERKPMVWPDLVYETECAHPSCGGKGSKKFYACLIVHSRPNA